ncbi:uncharacterized protein LOC110441567 [Mizuhopecten yessoensis]|nr:uncharacterized protein LOC110441567 [Mizuhopecten yessoensis]
MNCLLVVLMCGTVLVYGQTDGQGYGRSKRSGGHESGGHGSGGHGSGGKRPGEKESKCQNKSYDEIWSSKKYKYCSYDSVLSNMFYTKTDILDKTFKRQEAKIKQSKKWTTTNDPNDLPERQLQDYLRRKLHHQRSAAASYCCETTWSCVSPEIVEYNGRDYDVYQPDAGYQLVFQGQCGAGATCQHGQCTEEDNYYTWIIITVDDANYDPPILFVPVTFNNFCYCATI